MNESARLRGIIFDFDGTLADTRPVYLAAFRDTTRRAGPREYTADEIIPLFGPTEEAILQGIVGEGWEAAFRVFLEEYERAHDACPALFPGVPAALDLLIEGGIPLAMVTGKSRHTAAISVRRLGLDRYFAVIECGSPAGPVKPAALRVIAHKWDIPPEQIAYVGDTPLDMRDARETGLVALGAAWASSVRVEALRAQAPDELFTSVDAFVIGLTQLPGHRVVSRP